MHISRRVLAIALAALAAASLATVALAFNPQVRSLFGLKNGGNPTFAMTSSPSATSVDAGSSTIVTTTLASANGFSGTISLTSSVSPNTANAFTVSPTPSSIILTSGGTGTSTINLSTTNNIATGNYTITVVANSAGLSESASIAVRVLPAGSDFSMSSGVGGTIIMSQGWSVQQGLNLSAIGGFSGTVSLTTTVSPSTINSPTVTLSAYDVTLFVGGSSTSTVTISTTGTTTPGSYNLTIFGMSGSLTHSVTIPFDVTSMQENIFVENYYFASGTNLTLDIRNLSVVTVSLVSYQVTDSSGDMYYAATWNGPNIPANSVGIGKILIGSSCGNACTLTGSAFTFTTGYTYTVTLVTSHNNQFPFSFTR